MTRDAMPFGSPPPDDDEVASLVRDVAESWVMPPVRLDQPAWRERVRSPGARRAAAVRGWLGRLGQAATAAIAFTVVAALFAAAITGPRTGVGSSPSPSTRGTQRVSAGPTASPLPKLLVEGDLPSPSRVLVQVDEGDFATVDLATGVIGPSLTTSPFGSEVRQAQDGTLVCLCLKTGGNVNGSFTNATVSLNRYDRAGTVISRTQVLDVTGAPDPRDGAIFEQPGHAAAGTSFSADGRFAYIGWSTRAHPVWKSGLVVVDLATGSVAQRLGLPDRSDGEGDSRTFADAPRVIGQAGDHVVVSRGGYSWAPAASTNASYLPFADVFTAASSGGTLSGLQPLALGTGCGDDVPVAGALPGGGTWLSCLRAGTFNLTVIRRIASNGSLIGDVTVSSAVADGMTSAVSPDGSAIFIWNPWSMTLTRVDLATGRTTTGQAPPPTATTTNLLTALGRWLAPAVEAKVRLQSGIAVSPDGTRVYALGVRGVDGSGDATAGSSGVLVFDGATAAPVGQWSPTADFVSLAVSPDGAFVYAAGAPGVDAVGSLTNQPASITVFNAADGSARLVAGQLGSGFVTFPATTLP